jgi:multidrug resistance efflux pump
MNKSKAAWLCLTGVLLAGMTGMLALHRQALNRVQQENQLLRQQLAAQMARADQLVTETQRLSPLVGANQAEANVISPQGPSRDLLRLRGEVSRLHTLEKDTEAAAQDQMRAAQEKLTNAQADLALTTKLYEQGLVSASEFKEAKFSVEALKAEAKGDMAEAARVRLRQAEAQLSRAEELRSKNLISQTEYDEAVRKVASLRTATGH